MPFISFYFCTFVVILQRLKRLKTQKNALKRNFEPFLQGWLEAIADASLLDGGKYLSMPEIERLIGIYIIRYKQLKFKYGRKSDNGS